MWDVWASYWSWSRLVCLIVLLGIQCQYFWMFVHPWFMIHQSNCNVVRQFLVISGMSLSHQHLDSAWHFEDPAACEATLREILTARWTNRSIFVCSKCTPDGVRQLCHDVSCSSMVIQVHVDLYVRSPDELQRRHRRSMCFSAAGIQVIKHRYASMSFHAKVAHRRDMGHIRLCRM